MLTIEPCGPKLESMTIDRPPANALIIDLIRQMADHFAIHAQAAEPPAIILRGAGDRFFCAGGDIREVTENVDIAIPRMEEFHRLLTVMERYPAPIICAVSGYAVGAGIELVLHSDHVVAAQNAKFGFPEINNGLLPAAKGVRQSINRIGRRMTEHMLYTGDAIDASAALACGLVNEVVAIDELQNRAKEQAKLLGGKDAHLFAAIKRTLADVDRMTDQELGERATSDMAEYLGRAETVAAREKFLNRKEK